MKNTAWRMKDAKTPFSSQLHQFCVNFTVSFDLYVFSKASENDSWVFLIRKNHGQSH